MSFAFDLVSADAGDPVASPDEMLPNSVFIARFTDIESVGLKVAIKDCIDVVGFPSTMGSAALSDVPSARMDSTVVTALRASRCALVGKTSMHELAYGVTGFNSWAGTPLNPAWPDRIPGGSSSGSAVAVAQGDCDFALGTDTGGSVRTPAGCCGLFGLKTTYGRIDRGGVWPRSSSLDCVGPLARSAVMIERAMEALDPSWETSSVDLAGLRWAFVECDDAAQPMIYDTVKALCYGYSGRVSNAQLPLLSAAFDAGLTLIAFETSSAWKHLTGQGRLGADVEARLSKAALVSNQDVIGARRVGKRFRAQVDAALENSDVLVLPAFPGNVPKLSEASDPLAMVPLTRFQRPFNVSGHPVLLVPLRAGQESDGPLALQLVGAYGSDELLVAMARALELTNPEIFGGPDWGQRSKTALAQAQET